MCSFNSCFLTYIQVSPEAGQVVWYSHLVQNFTQFIVIHTVKGFGIVNKAEIVFLELSCFFDDPSDVGNLISGSSAFSKTSLNIWKFTVHILLKPGLENFEHYSTSVWEKLQLLFCFSSVYLKILHTYCISVCAEVSIYILVSPFPFILSPPSHCSVSSLSSPPSQITSFLPNSCLHLFCILFLSPWLYNRIQICVNIFIYSTHTHSFFWPLFALWKNALHIFPCLAFLTQLLLE